MVVPENLIGMEGQVSYLFMLSYVLEGKAIKIAFLWPAEILVVKYMVNSKIIQTLTYLKANSRMHGTLHTLPKPPPSFDDGDWLTVR